MTVSNRPGQQEPPTEAESPFVRNGSPDFKKNNLFAKETGTAVE